MRIYPKGVTPLRYDLSFDTRFARYSGWSDFHKPFVPSSDPFDIAQGRPEFVSKGDLGGSPIEGLRADGFFSDSPSSHVSVAYRGAGFPPFEGLRAVSPVERLKACGNDGLR